jgi:D-serine dehydratase
MTMPSPLADLLAIELDDRVKGLPPGVTPFPLGAIGEHGWRVLDGDLPLPLALLKDRTLAHNGDWMRRFLAAGGAKLAPHGKTTMSPQLFHRQLADGAWAITLATAQQVAVAHRYGVRRVVLANQLVGPAATAGIVDLLRRDPGFDFYCVADSVANVAALAEASRAAGLERPIKLLLEGGYRGGRTGVRSLADGLAVARAIAAAAPRLDLVGVEGFEGIIAGGDDADTERKIADFLDFLVELAGAALAEKLFAAGPLLLTAGGSAFYDMVVERFAAARLGRPVEIVIRSGCYLTHDSVLYQAAFRRLLDRSATARRLGDGLQPALELWAHVQSRPEPTRAIVGFGKRDCSYDAGLPVPLCWHRPGAATPPQPLGADHRIVAVNDQHGYLDLPAAAPLAVGDMMGFGIAHPCLTFDKWQLLPIVDDEYRVIDAIRTFF